MRENLSLLLRSDETIRMGNVKFEIFWGWNDYAHSVKLFSTIAQKLVSPRANVIKES